jgi:hypothetical protein
MGRTLLIKGNDMKVQVDLPEEDRGCMRRHPDKEPDWKEVFAFLEYLRTTGKTNMFGATKYVEFYLDVPKDKAQELTKEWMFKGKQKALMEVLHG